MQIKFIFIGIFSWLLTVVSSSDAAINYKTQINKRLALLIGNADYKTAPLKNPLNDVRELSRCLDELNFKTIVVEDATKKAMLESIREFRRLIPENRVILFYYSGHGFQVNGRNYLIPIDADIQTLHDTEIEAMDLGRVINSMNTDGGTLNIVILDACRTNPFAHNYRSIGTYGFAKMSAPKGTIISYATSPGKTAADGSGIYGVYTESLLNNIRIMVALMVYLKVCCSTNISYFRHLDTEKLIIFLLYYFNRLHHNEYHS